jgi:thymidylate kinase
MRLLLEGISGTGKTTQARRIVRHLRGMGSVEAVGEFSQGPIGRAIRRCYRDRQERFVRFHGREPFADQTHLVLLADTVAKAEEMSRSAAGVLVVDRLFDSWLCYTLTAGNRRGLDDAMVRELHRDCSREHVPAGSVTVFLDLGVPAALERLATRDGFGSKQGEARRLEAVAQRFAELYSGTQVRRVDASRPPAELTAAILEAAGLKI